jgi:hypothetical protein
VLSRGGVECGTMRFYCGMESGNNVSCKHSALSTLNLVKWCVNQDQLF